MSIYTEKHTDQHKNTQNTKTQQPIRHLCFTVFRLVLKNTKTSFFLNFSCVMVFYVFFCRSMCWFLYGPFCHGALKLDISTLFTTFFLCTSLQFMLQLSPSASSLLSNCIVIIVDIYVWIKTYYNIVQF